MENNLLPFTIKLAKKTGDLILKSSKKTFKITEKAKNDFVTEIDTKSENFIIKEIKKNFPNDSILAEETRTTLEKTKKIPEYIWIIDPIDGTTNFARGFDHYAISIAIFKTKATKSSNNFKYFTGEIIIGVIHAPKLKQTFYAEKGKGAFLNGKKISVSTVQKVKNSILATGFPANQKEPNIHYFSKMLDECQAIRRFGAASLDLAYTAAGLYDGYWELNLKPWDMAAGALIVEEAGGKVSDGNGNLLDLFGQDILVSNGRIHKEIVEIFKKIQPPQK